MQFDRRNFLTSFAALGSISACRFGSWSRQSTPASDIATAAKKLNPTHIRRNSESIGVADIASSEAIIGTEFSPEERALMLDKLEQHIIRIKKVRPQVWDHELSPATRFDPRLPNQRGITNYSLPSWTFDANLKLPPRDEDIAFASLSELASWIATGKISSLRLTELYLSRLREFGDELQCVVTLIVDNAIEQAKRADQKISQGQYIGPLHGIPWGAKDLLSTADAPTTWGATPYKDQILVRDAVVVRRLHEAGAILVAKLSLGELAYGDVWYGGKTKNPWYLGEGSSGSSAGSAAAVSAGLVGFAIGSETFGSILSPCMRCGVTGLRPTFGRVARTGAMPLCWSLDKLGPITRNVNDTGLVLDCISGADPGDPDSIELTTSVADSRSLSEIKVGYVAAHFSDKSAQDLDRKALKTLDELGVQIHEISLPKYPYNSLLSIIDAESATAFEELSLSNRDEQLRQQDEDSWPNVFRSARFITAIDFLQAQRMRRKIMQDFAKVFDQVDLIISPTFAEPLELATNFTGHPALTFPVGTRVRKPDLGWGNSRPDHDAADIIAPYGTTLWGRLFDEGTLIRVGQALENKLVPEGLRPPRL